jgi:hypothetical protein
MKINPKKKKTESFYILGHLLEFIIKTKQFGFFFLQNLMNLDHFLSMKKNPLYIGWNQNFQVEVKKYTKKYGE